MPSEPLQQLKPEDRAAYWQLEKVAKTPGELVGFMADCGFNMDVERARAIIAARDKGASLEGRDVVYDRPKPIDQGDGAAGSFLRGAGDVATFGMLDEAGGLIDTLGGTGGRESIWNSDRPFKDVLYGNIDANRAVITGDQENHPVARFSGQVAGGLAIPIGVGANTAGALARVGAGVGGAYGFGSGEGGVLDRLPSAGGGALAGATGGYAFGRAAPVVGSALARFGGGGSRVRQEANALLQAADRQDVPMQAADIRPGARNLTAFLEASPGGAGPIQNSLLRGSEGLEAAVGRLGGSGTAGTREGIGDTVQGAGRRGIEWSRQQKDRMYLRAERLAGGTTVRSMSAVQALDNHIAELSQTEGANRGALGLLRDLRHDLVDDAGVRPLSVQAIRNLRTAIRGEIGTRNLTMTDVERRVSDVIDAASTDITQALGATSPEAGRAYQQADRFYRERQTYINDVISRFIGPRDANMSGEQTFARLEAMARPQGDARRLGQMMRLLSPDEQADVAATIAGQLGRSGPDETFSGALFARQAKRLSPGARRVIFGPDGATAITDLIRIAEAKTASANALNRSRSGQVANYAKALSDMVLGAGGGAAVGGPAGAMAGAAGMAAVNAGIRNASARLLTNPRFVAWLGRAPATANPRAIELHVRRLGVIATREPAIRAEIMGLQRMLTQDLGRASAEGGDEDR